MSENKFFLFICSFMPGAGHMYLKMMKKGVLMMGAFFGVVCFSDVLQLEILWCLTPIVWFYSFFDTFHMASLDLETRKRLDLEFYQKAIQFRPGRLSTVFHNRRKVISGCIFLIVLYELWQEFIVPFYDRYCPVSFSMWEPIFYKLPSLVVMILLIVFAIHLLRSADDEDDWNDEDDEKEDFDLEERFQPEHKTILEHDKDD